MWGGGESEEVLAIIKGGESLDTGFVKFNHSEGRVQKSVHHFKSGVHEKFHPVSQGGVQKDSDPGFSLPLSP